MRYPVLAALAATAGCAQTPAEHISHHNQAMSKPDVLQVRQLLEENAALSRLLTDQTCEWHQDTDLDRHTTRQAPADRQKVLECMLAEVRAVQQCEIWYRNESEGTTFDQKMMRCVAQHNYVETPGDCKRTL